MEIIKLKSSDFSLRKEESFFYFNERSDSKEGENIKRDIYTSRCKVLGRNVKLQFAVDNPTGDLDLYLDKVKEILLWAENNTNVIYLTMTAKRSGDLLDNNETKKMSNEQFISFLCLEQVLTSYHHSGEIYMELIFNELDNCPGVHFAFDIQPHKKYMSAYHRGLTNT